MPAPVEKSPRVEPSIADGLSRVSHTTADYGEAGLAIETLLSLVGEDAVPRLVSCLVERGTWPPCLEQLTGLQPRRFEAQALLEALQAVRDLSGDRITRYEAARARLSEGDPAGALEQLDPLVESGNGPFDREARLEIARALVLLGRPEQALDQIEALLLQGDYGPELGVEALAFEAAASRRAGLHDRADRVCGDLLRFYSREGGPGRDECERSRSSLDRPLQREAGRIGAP